MLYQMRKKKKDMNTVRGLDRDLEIYELFLT